MRNMVEIMRKKFEITKQNKTKKTLYGFLGFLYFLQNFCDANNWPIGNPRPP